MEFTFLHAADLHLNSPFQGLALKDEAIASRFAAATRAAFTALISRALEAKIDFVIIAGDVYDGEWKDNSIGLFFNREIARLERADIPVYLVKGNHDAESVVTKTIQPRTNVTTFASSKAATHTIPALKVALHGQSFPQRAVPENYALTYPAPTPGWFNIGVLHTSCDGRPPHANYAPCSVQDLINRGYDYWALGHIHEYEVLSQSPWAVFPGNLQGRSVRECGPKGAVLVTVSDGLVSAVDRLIVDCARWASIEIGIEDNWSQRSILEAIRERLRPVVDQAEGRLLAFRVTLSGATTLDSELRANLHDLTDEVQAEAQGLHPDAWLERLVIATEPLEQPATGPTTSLDLAALLAGLRHSPDFEARAHEVLASIRSKLPHGASWDESLDDILHEASALVLARASGSERKASRAHS